MHNVLVIDDEGDVRDGIKRVLERAGFSVRTLDNATDALLELKRAPTDVVITDIIMPKLSGVDAIHRIVQEFPRVRIVAISGGGNFDASSYQPGAITTTAYLAAAKNAGAHFILTKPFESRELIDAVKQVISAGHA
ncbi:MAG TPA: response regulator [Steroidobacteraceae bacterium]|jgi:CheY-like chemotaxis protein|nr:response regulator [Steroidobacteraceae bacterium]